MISVISRVWRFFATGICFAVFGLGGLGLAIIVFPISQVMMPHNFQDRNKRIIRRGFKLFVNLMQYLGVIRFEIQGKYILEKDSSCLIVANHPTLIDYVVIGSMLDSCNCIVKEALWSNIFLSGVVRAAGYIPNNGAVNVIESCRQSMLSNNVLIVFPEGTRTKYNTPINLKRGAANIAVRTNSPIRIIHIECVPSTLTKEEKWYDIPMHIPIYKLRVGELVQMNQFIDSTNNLPKAARKLTDYLQTQLSTGI
ncbi:1-acyl-sn-glycerol-3-phosphate acyltransferase [bacterium]|nr:1-acyl-sn-glycerol-3-phosphate acyltransferase [bacterium]